ncbi:hypothetical protein niasHT_031257 [Heterodera trifolii]|uniref:Uncharacterized protein n=1 Tax=Heterodera trifolii TaxID=157864 RepID=A0ABD2INR0_9BILA
MSTDRALEEVMRRKGRFTATWTVSTPAVFRKWREMGLAELYANDEEQGEGARNSFRKLLALALIPEQHVRRGFALIVNHAPDGLAAFFGYFARVYVGLTAHEQEAGALAFAPGADQSRRSSISTNATGDVEYSLRNSFSSGAIDRRCIGRGGVQHRRRRHEHPFAAESADARICGWPACPRGSTRT